MTAHTDGDIWRATFKHDGRIVRGCIERFSGRYLCTVGGELFGRADDLLTVQLAVLRDYGCPVAAWSQIEGGS